MSYTQASILLQSDRLYREVSRQAQRAENERRWLTAARLHLWLAKRVKAILGQRGATKGVTK